MKVVMASLVMILRRLVFFALALSSTAGGAYLMSIILGANDWSTLHVIVMALFTLVFGWLMLSFWTGMMGFYVRLRHGDPLSLTQRIDPKRLLKHQTALVMPIYNEDTDRVLAGIEATLSQLKLSPERRRFEVFILSDTTDPEIARREEQKMAAFAAADHNGIKVHYRRRARNIGRKAGNLEDFVRRWGKVYAHMLVLDADSVMMGETLLALARMMEQNPDAGIIQTIPMPVNRETPFARILQFAARLYGPLMASGLAYWAGGEANYYGHNAIIRLDAFARYCGLPVLPGKAPLGGEILSHDFVEAGLIRRGGYKVWLVPELDGSFEEMPANIIDYAKRDRRWCQGNMQHGRLVLGIPGLKGLSRLHLAMGVFSYLASPVWFALLALASTDILDSAIVGPVYFKSGFSLFPDWPIIKSAEINMLLLLTLIALFLPKILGLILVLIHGPQRRAFGGAIRLILSAFFETLFSVLLAPVMMLFQSLFVTATLFGHNVRWDAQGRDDRGLGWGEALRRHGGHTVIGLAWGAIVLYVTPDYFWWLMPVLSGLVLSIPMSVLSSRLSIGLALKRWGLFLTPDETRPAAELVHLREALEREAAPVPEIPQMLSPEGVPVPLVLAPEEAGLPMSHMPWPQLRGLGAKGFQAAN
jgi:membrane glycosyltransferase